MKGASAEKVTGFRVRKVSPPPRFTLRPLLATSPQLVLEKAASRVLAHLCHTRLFISLPTDEEEEEEDGPMHEDRLWTLTQAARLLSVTQTGATSSLRVAPVGSRGLTAVSFCDPTFDQRSQQSRTGHLQGSTWGPRPGRGNLKGYLEETLLSPACRRKKNQPATQGSVMLNWSRITIQTVATLRARFSAPHCHRRKIQIKFWVGSGRPWG